jgi:hypothetical protein
MGCFLRCDVFGTILTMHYHLYGYYLPIQRTSSDNILEGCNNLNFRVTSSLCRKEKFAHGQLFANVLALSRVRCNVKGYLSAIRQGCICGLFVPCGYSLICEHTHNVRHH